VRRQITSSASRRSDAAACAEPTGTATLTRLAPRALATRQAARAVEPVAIPVVHHDRGAARQRHRRPVAAQPAQPAVQPVPFPHLHAGDFLPGQPGQADHAVVDHPGAVLADGAEAVLRLERDAELTHHDHVERGPQLPGHLERDGHAAARQGEHDGIGAPQVPQPPCQLPSRVRTINGQHRMLLCVQCGPAAGSAAPAGSTS
jgi:hypothetical protein